jgi:tetratricopeptide (TPR) repeat protein
VKRFARLRWFATAIALAAGAAPVMAQGSSQEMIDGAIRLYEVDLNIERALIQFRQIISPSSPFEVSRTQRVTAYKYIGAALAATGQRDSAIVYFRAALERDPFLDLDPNKFTEQEREALSQAKLQSFKMGVVVGEREFASGRYTLDPQTDAVAVKLISTHAGDLRVEFINLANQGERYPLYRGDNDGFRDLRWNGTVAAGRLIPEGSWELRAWGRSVYNQKEDSASFTFDVAWDYPALEDTLPTLGQQYLLPESHPGSAAWRDLVKGTFLGLAAGGLGFLVKNQIDGETSFPQLSLAMAGTGLVAGTTAFFVRRRNVAIRENVAENTRRRAARDALNAEIVRRNNERLAQTKLILTPTAGVVR